VKYLIRHDLPAAHTCEVERLADVLATVLPSGVDVEIADLPAPRALAFEAGVAVVSLDKRYTGDYQLHACRLFADHARGDDQSRPVALVARPGTGTLAQQVAALPAGRVVFVDDDVASGFTRDHILSLVRRLRPDIEVTGWERFADAYTGEVFDVVDASDFIAPASNNGGLVVNVDGVWMRRPYWSAHVNLPTRARIPNSIKPLLRAALTPSPTRPARTP
jgi:hypothetical protein